MVGPKSAAMPNLSQVLSQQLSASAVFDHEALLVPLANNVYPKPVLALPDLHRIDAEQR
jgi:hypothetical protein